MKLLLYCTKSTKNKLLVASMDYKDFMKFEEDGIDRSVYYLTDYRSLTDYGKTTVCNGKIVAECDFEVEEIFEDNYEDARDGYVEHFYKLKSYDDFDEGQKVLLKESCLQKHELSNYLGFENGYAIHIKNLHIFDEPKELNSARYKNHSVKSAPQNMMKVYDYSGEYYILISIKPEWLCKILNGEKTIEVRKKVLKEML